MYLTFDAVYYEPQALLYPLGIEIKEKFTSVPWIPIESHNHIPELSGAENRDFPKLKRHLVLGIRKTHAYTENHKVSDWLVPYTSSGCRAMCLYCYLVCNYNKCAYLRLFVNREQMFEKLLKTDREAENMQTFEIGSNSDLVLENQITGNLAWTIERFGKLGRGHLTFPTKFDQVETLLQLNHQGKTIVRMSVNPDEIIRRVELGTSPLKARIRAINEMAEAGYPVGLLIAPVILVEDWKRMYSELINTLASELSERVKTLGFLEIILMTYGFTQNAINPEAFPNALSIFDPNMMIGRGRGKYRYREEYRSEAEDFLKREIESRLKMPILYIS